jgi:hypothetical protein
MVVVVVAQVVAAVGRFGAIIVGRKLAVGAVACQPSGDRGGLERLRL